MANKAALQNYAWKPKANMCMESSGRKPTSFHMQSFYHNKGQIVCTQVAFRPLKTKCSVSPVWWLPYRTCLFIKLFWCSQLMSKIWGTGRIWAASQLCSFSSTALVQPVSEERSLLRCCLTECSLPYSRRGLLELICTQIPFLNSSVTQQLKNTIQTLLFYAVHYHLWKII